MRHLFLPYFNILDDSGHNHGVFGKKIDLKIFSRNIDFMLFCPDADGMIFKFLN